MSSEQQQIHHYLAIEDESGKRIVPLTTSTYSIGRHSSNSIVLKSRFISRQHAILLRVTTPHTSNYTFRIIDGDLQGNRSTNGLFVNNQVCKSRSLQHGDLILFGKYAKAKYFTIPNFNKLELIEAQNDEDLFDLLSKSHRDYPTVALPDGETKNTSEIALVRLASFPELTPSPIIEINLDGAITYLNPAAVKQFPTLRKVKLQHPIIANLISSIKQEQKKYFIREVEIDGRIYEQVIHYIHESNLIRSYIIDITEHKRTEEALRKIEAKNRALLNAIPDLIFQLSSDGIILDIKPAKDYTLDLPAREVISKNVCEVLPSEVAHQTTYYIKQALRTHENQVFEYERLINNSAAHYEVRIVATTENEVLAIIRNVTKRKLLEIQLLHDALHDALTGLPNRNLFMNRLTHVVDLAKRRNDYLFAVLFIDLDRFKVINDSLGHIIGDQLLVAISSKLKACLRPGDTVARLGGDEFAILLEDINSINDATLIAERIQQELLLPLNLDGHEVFTTASIGIVSSAIRYERPEELLRDADTAMYHAKSLGKSRYELFDSTMHARVVALLQLENDLRRAVERQEFQIYYQPIVSLTTGKIAGFEALVRWQHPEHGLVSPDAFIQLAEETGLILPIGEWILYEACQQAQLWQALCPEQPPLTISVNISSKQFSQPNLAKQIGQILRQTKLQPSSLKLEITESIIMENTKLTKAAIEDLKALNIHLCLDDFGTGYSSLSYLHSFPVDTLKADRSFISAMDISNENSSLNITRTIMMLAHNLGINVVAEGVETAKQLMQLKALKCQFAQGYFFSKPLAREEAEALIISEPQW